MFYDKCCQLILQNNMPASSSRPRVLIFSTAYFPLVGGAEVAVQEITDRLVDYDFEMITAKLRADLPSVEIIGRVKVYRLGFGLPADKIILAVGGGWYALWLHRQANYVLVWSVMASFGGLAGAVFGSWRPEIPVVLTLQEGDDLKSIERKAWLVWPWFSAIFTSATSVQCISTYLATWAKELGARGPVEVIPNGVDLEVFTPAKNKFILDHQLVVTTSRLVKKNGVDLLIKAMTRLPQPVHLAIIGDGPERENLVALAKELKVSDRVEFVGYLVHQDMITYLRHADVFVRASRSEGLGNSFLEAMAVGVPVVGTPVGGIVDFLHEGETGFLAWPEDMQSIADKINFILNPENRTKVATVTAQAQKLVRAEYAWEAVVLRLRQIFDLLTQ
jgi:glycosyltransferase involved in cell wall biosynthesis